MAEVEEKNLIQNYLKGNEQSLEILIKKYLKPIYSFSYKNVGNQAAAEDITQEVFIKVWKNIKKFDQNKNFKPWIFQIAKNTSIDYLRKKKTIPFSRFENERGQNFLSENLEAKPANLIGNLSDKKVLAGVMKTLDEKGYKIINLRHNEGMSFKEIAETLHESINTVKSRYRRNLQLMRRKLRNK